MAERMSKRPWSTTGTSSTASTHAEASTKISTRNNISVSTQSRHSMQSRSAITSRSVLGASSLRRAHRHSSISEEPQQSKHIVPAHPTRLVSSSRAPILSRSSAVVSHDEHVPARVRVRFDEHQLQSSDSQFAEQHSAPLVSSTLSFKPHQILRLFPLATASSLPEPASKPAVIDIDIVQSATNLLETRNASKLVFPECNSYFSISLFIAESFIQPLLN